MIVPEVPVPQPQSGGTVPVTRHEYESSSAAKVTEPASQKQELVRAYEDLLLAYYRRETEILSEHKSTIAATNVIGYLICIVAHLLLALAVWAAIREYREAARQRKTRNVSQELQLSLEGISLKTSLHGTILLVLAIVFYFMYVKFIYPISTVDF